MKFGDLLDTSLRKRGMTGRELARRMKISPTSISFWRTGETYPRVRHLKQLCEVFPDWDFEEVQALVNDEKLAGYISESEIVSPYNEQVPLYREGELVEFHSLPRALGATNKSRLVEVNSKTWLLVQQTHAPTEGDAVVLDAGGEIITATVSYVASVRCYLRHDSKPPIPESDRSVRLVGKLALTLTRS